MTHPNLVDTLVTGSGDRVEQPHRRTAEVVSGGLLTDQRADTSPPVKQKWQPKINSFLPDQLGEEPPHFALVVSVSPAAAEKKAALEVERDRLREAFDALDDLPAERKIAQEQADRTVADALAAGKPMPTVKTVDWEARQATLEAEVRVRSTRAREAHRDYHATVKAELPAAMAALVALIPSTVAEARAVWQPSPLQRLATLLGQLDIIAVQVDPDDVAAIVPPEVRRIRSAGVAAIDAISAWLASDHPAALGGRFTEQSEVQPPLWVREALAESERNADVARLAEIEHLQDKPPLSVTSYTRHLSHLFQRAQ